MDVQFSPEPEAQILQIAESSGTPGEQLVKQAALRMEEETLGRILQSRRKSVDDSGLAKLGR